MKNFNRRRFIKILGLSGLGALAGGIVFNSRNQPLHKIYWRGIALGAPSEITLYHTDKLEGQEILNQRVNKIKPLENLFSLYNDNSKLSILNKSGKLHNPDLEMVELFSLAKKYSEYTDGAFDITVQPLWNLYHKSFSERNTPPKDKDLNKVLELVDWKSIEISENKISFLNKGMSATLNGIAQGYITDKITEILLNHGIDNTLIQLGEYRAIGNHPDNRKWRLLLSNPENSGSIGEIEFENAAIATSAGKGTIFDESGKYHHIFNPKNGLCSNKIMQTTVTSNTATEADALATAFLIMDLKKSKKISNNLEIGFEYLDTSRSRKVISYL